ncbi:mannitol dehydrogenase family protein [Providencia sp. PROV197]|uniref:mannitol dehydrogenase family protein n=1 Tax=Providencia sp. PROV197 TaxID=2949898 RepID=UPI002349FEBD|nr:fructuronate reductase [Providencia sp. PROV197]
MDNNRHQLVPRIVHLGFGAFHRAHQALYTHLLIEQSQSDWGYCEINLMSARGAELIRQLNKRHCTYVLLEKDEERTTLTRINSVKEAMHPRIDGVHAVIEKMAAPETAIISLTITEKGYCTDPSTNKLNLSHPAIRHDIAYPETPESVLGYILAALKIRFQQNLPPVTILSCDNIRNNGEVARNAILSLAAQQDSELALWIKRNITFPSTMVDRIVPAMTEDSFAEIKQLTGEDDPCAVISEPFRQWVIEDCFANGRPDWHYVGAQFVKDVAPYEMMKLRMLNGSHSFLAYLGYLGGYEFISDAMQNQDYYQIVQRIMLAEQKPTLSLPDNIDLNQYAQQLLTRFANRAIKHKTAQIAVDGSQKLPQRLLDSILWHQKKGSDYPLLALGVAAWMRYVSGINEDGEPIPIKDPLSDEFSKIYQHHGTSLEAVDALLKIDAIFSPEISQHNDIVNKIKTAYQQLLTLGARQTVKYYLTKID